MHVVFCILGQLFVKMKTNPACHTVLSTKNPFPLNTEASEQLLNTSQEEAPHFFVVVAIATLYPLLANKGNASTDPI
jgi:hypothetical protein